MNQIEKLNRKVRKDLANKTQQNDCCVAFEMFVIYNVLKILGCL